MRARFSALFLIISISAAAQPFCYCDQELFEKDAVSCDTIKLNNKGFLYYQYNCDTIWLTYELPDRTKKVIFSMGSELGGYNYRLGYLFIKEFNNSMLFRYGCPANGPCEYILISKRNGHVVKKFNQLIYTSEGESTNIVIYFTDHTFNRVSIFNADTHKTYHVKTPGNRFKFSMRPEHQFENSELKNGKLILFYRYPVNDDETNWQTDKIIINIKK